ncbi:hypothetical protein [Thalassospira sp. HJ]|uniref:hypothetical protein n=1 Tax=Thalassospira sp. HJ TaxID=1616823 RepID=UPI0005CEF6EF|nr:hypothetical protein [Thalassospira sp. HJ]
MAIEKVHLRKLLQLFGMKQNKLVSQLRRDILQSLKGGEGRDFYTPFWADVKQHVIGEKTLSVSVAERVEKSDQRKRRYPELEKGFLEWWNEKRRWINEPFEFLDQSVRGVYTVEDPELTVKLENMLSLKIGDNAHRIIYPYFNREPALTEQLARQGLFVLSRGITQYKDVDFRIVDLTRSRSFSVQDLPFQGDEEESFIANYQRVRDLWFELLEQY